MPNSAANHVQRHCRVSARRFLRPAASSNSANAAERGEKPLADFRIFPAAKEILPRQRIDENQKREQAELFRHSGKFGKRRAPQTIARAEINQSQQRIEQHLPFRLAINQTAAFVDLEAEPDAEREQQQDVLRLRPQQPRQRGDANPPEQKRVRRARDDVVNLADERDVGEKQARADQVQRLAGLPVFALDFAQPPAAARARRA